jgi:hypothetical protein
VLVDDGVLCVREHDDGRDEIVTYRDKRRVQRALIPGGVVLGSNNPEMN